MTPDKRRGHEARIYAAREAKKLAALDPRDVQERAIYTMLRIFAKNLSTATAERDAAMAALWEAEKVVSAARLVRETGGTFTGFLQVRGWTHFCKVLAAHSAATKPTNPAEKAQE